MKTRSIPAHAEPPGDSKPPPDDAPTTAELSAEPVGAPCAESSEARRRDGEPPPTLSGSTCPELDDVVDIASKESFPASDPPAYLSVHL